MPENVRESREKLFPKAPKSVCLLAFLTKCTGELRHRSTVMWMLLWTRAEDGCKALRLGVVGVLSDAPWCAVDESSPEKDNLIEIEGDL